MTNQPTPETCPVYVYRGGYRGPCGRPVKSNGKCGLHAAATKRREAKREYDRIRAEVSYAAKEAAEKAQRDLSDVGVPSRTEYPRYQVELSPESAEKVADRLGGIVVRDDDYLRDRIAIRLAAAAGIDMEGLATLRLEGRSSRFDIAADAVLCELRWISEDQR